MSKAGFIIRWDDVSPFQDHRKYRSLIDLFLKYNIPAVLGVIPDNRDESIKFDRREETDFVEELHQLERSGWEIAQHGYRHMKQTEDGGILNLNQASEFAGRTLDDQLADIKNGRQILEGYGFNPVTFIPPWHSYDQATLTALEQTGFKIISDGMFLYPRRIGSLIQLPQIFWSVPGRMKTLTQMGSVYTICLHPQLITGDDLKSLERFFNEATPEVFTASSLLVQGKSLTRRGVKKLLLEGIFGFLYKRNR